MNARGRAASLNEGKRSMPRNRQPAGSCPRCTHGTVQCSYNTFDNAGERIDSWEHRCVDCSYRETKAYRAGGTEGEPGADSELCPFCGRRAR